MLFASFVWANEAQPRLINTSVRAQVLTGEKTIILGFVITGAGDKKVVIRAIGPGLDPVAPSLVGKTCKDPSFTVYRGSVPIFSNMDWDGSEATKRAFSDVGAFALPQGSKDAGALLTLAPGLYTVHVTGSDSGIALCEVYDADKGIVTSRITNMSARGFAGSGDNVFIPAFVFYGNSSPRPFIMISAGPSLKQFSVVGVAEDPRMWLFDHTIGAYVASNDDWDHGLQSLMNSVGAGWLVSNKDAALTHVLSGPRTLSLVIEGKGTGGVVLGQIFDLTN